MRIIHSDLCGSIESATLSGERYVLTFVADYSLFCELRLIKEKIDIALDLKCVRGKLQKVARNASAENQPWPPYTPQMNEVAERMNRTLFAKACAMLYDSKLPKNCWDMQPKKSKLTPVAEFLVIKLVFVPTELQLEQEE
ncbi:hypothetical protein AVEN_23979-1 [Araneus ventricosus]|uniref:Integrase catalytic domain-containing protein n=1 Tax=Araneus ventricosus TaxID=182803 RepID=A0A4Y2QP84_ARAVE|nr:hypothetical protein AVEN_23979-1 [Araneus ventricosus]